MRKIQTLLSLTLATLVILCAVGCDDEKDETPIQPTIETTIQPTSIEQSSIEPTIDSSIPPAFAGLASVSLQDDMYHLSWEPAVDDQTDQDSIMYEIFEADSTGIDNYDFLNPVASVVGAASIDISDLDTFSHHYFIVRTSDEHNNTDENTIEQTQRDLMLVGAPNFRDLGGYVNSDGIQIEWGQIYRSGDLATLTDADSIIVNGLDLNMIMDIREQDDIDRDGYDVIYAGNEAIYDFLYCNSGDPALLVELPDHPLKKLAVDVRLVDYPNWYINILEENKEAIKAAFEHYANQSDHPILVHCTQGKDRAGVISALLLTLLDVPEVTIIEDFLLTCELTVEDIEEKMAGLEGILPVLDIVPEGVTAEDWRPMLGCPQNAMENLLDHIEAKYNGIEDYLISIGITSDQQQTIRDILLRDG